MFSLTAIPELLAILYLKGCIDTMDTQTEIVETIREKEADYLLLVKANQPTLSMTWKDASPKPKPSNGEVFNIQCTESVDGGNGRVETRTCWAMPLPKAMAEQA